MVVIKTRERSNDIRRDDLKHDTGSFYAFQKLFYNPSNLFI